jgi:tungstate transport system ATP-binding protein
MNGSAHAFASMLPLRLENVGYTARARNILHDVSADFTAGTRTIVLGANGAGKSVLLRICHGLLTPTSGMVRWNAAEVRGRARRQAMVFQRPVMLRRSAEENIRYALALAGVPRGERSAQAQAALERVGLQALAHHAARTLSGGEQQRLALARAWALRPEVLFLDEPTASLDPGAINAIEAIVEAMHAEGTKIVMVTHNLGQARRLGDEILFLHEGRLTERTPAERFFKRPDSVEAERFLRGELPW